MYTCNSTGKLVTNLVERETKSHNFRDGLCTDENLGMARKGAELYGEVDGGGPAFFLPWTSFTEQAFNGCGLLPSQQVRLHVLIHPSDAVR